MPRAHGRHLDVLPRLWMARLERRRVEQLLDRQNDSLGLAQGRVTGTDAGVVGADPLTLEEVCELD